ncbi:MAG: glycosyltransferase family 4 protein [Mogibacterium sp.]|nr:glycosyltransferase family 4 protein [Mogibacterium sp.]
MKKVLFVATVVKLHIMEFHLPYLRMFKELGWETAVAARNDYEDPADCAIPFCDRFYDIPFERDPFSAGNLRAYRALKAVLDRGDFDIIHCHTPVGGALTRLCAGNARRNGSKVIYTAHGFHFYQGAPLRNRLLYYPVERWLARRTDVLITINREDWQRAQKFRAGRVCLVPGVGVDTAKFRGCACDRAEKRRALGLRPEDPVLVSVGELTAGKGQGLCLEALGVLKKRGQLGTIRYLLCGSGPHEELLRKRAEELQLSEHVRFAGYRTDIPEILKCCDLFVSFSEREGLPVSVMEAMASGLPVLCSDVRGHRDLIRSGYNGELSARTPEAAAEAILRLITDADTRARYASAAQETIRDYDIENVRRQMLEIYQEVMADETGSQK